MEKWIWVGMGGFLGSISRYGVTLLVSHFPSSPYPLAITVVNLAGSFLLGMAMRFFGSHAHENLSAFVMIGFLGSFTTLSTISAQSFELLRTGEYFFLSLHLFFSFFVAVLAFWGGLMLTKFFI